MRQSLLFQFGSYPVSARELWEEEWITRGVVISTGCPCLDDVLGGGLVCGQLTEICGPPASGKTQAKQNSFSGSSGKNGPTKIFNHRRYR